MARTGRPRKPKELKVVQGKFGKSDQDGKKKGQASLAPDAPDKPDSLDDIESQIWDNLIAVLNNIGTLQKCDAGSLESYCTVYASMIRHKNALVKFRKENDGCDFYTTEGKHGLVYKIHPAVGAIERATKIIKALAEEFGMTPASRKGMGYDPKQLMLPGLTGQKETQFDPTKGMID